MRRRELAVAWKAAWRTAHPRMQTQATFEGPLDGSALATRAQRLQEPCTSAHGLRLVQHLHQSTAAVQRAPVARPVAAFQTLSARQFSSYAPSAAPAAAPTFLRFYQPYSPPTLDPAEEAPQYAPLARALLHGDEPRAWTEIEKLRATGAAADIPEHLWHAAWALIAQGPPSPSPADSVYPRLDGVCKRLCELRDLRPALTLHNYQRLLYLLLKRAERFVGPPQDARLHAQLLSNVAGAQPSELAAMDVHLLGRLVFRVARLDALDLALPLLDAYAARSDQLADPRAGAQPYIAVMEACVKAQQPVLGVEVLRMAHAQQLSVPWSLVQRLLRLLPQDELAMLFDMCYAHTDAAPAAADPSRKSHSDAKGALRALASSSPRYLAQRTAVALCVKNDPRTALRCIAELPSSDVSFDVYATAISALTWIARDHPQTLGSNALLLALRTLDALQRGQGGPAYDGDEQLYGELVRAFDAVLGEKLGGQRSPGKAQEGQAPAPNSGAQPDGSPPGRGPLPAGLSEYVQQAVSAAEVGRVPQLLRKFTSDVLRGMYTWNHRVLRLSHHETLLYVNVRAGNYMHSKRLYEQARRAFPSVLPWPRGTAQDAFRLLIAACRRPNQMHFALRVYHDWLAFGHLFPLRVITPLLGALLGAQMPAAAQRVVRDLRDSRWLPQEVLLPTLVNAFLDQGLWDVAVAVAHTASDDTDVALPASATWQEAEPALGDHPPLVVYGTLLYEASRTRARGAPVPPAASIAELFDEFRLALAHGMSTASVEGMDEAAIRGAYYGAVRLRLQAAGLDGGDASSSPEERAEHIAAACELLDELAALGVHLDAEARELRMLAALATARHLEKHGADATLQRCAAHLFDKHGVAADEADTLRSDASGQPATDAGERRPRSKALQESLRAYQNVHTWFTG